MAPLDPWIIEEIKKREEEKRRRGEIQPELPVERPHDAPERRDDRAPDPGYEMPNPNEPKRDERPAKKEESDRGVTTIDIGGADDEDDPNVIDIADLPKAPPEEDEKKPD